MKLLHRDVIAALPQLFRDRSVPPFSVPLPFGQLLLKMAVPVIHTVSQDMDAFVLPGAGNLNSGNGPDPCLRAGLQHEGCPFSGVVVREDQGGKPLFLCVRNDLSGSEGSVRVHRMKMEIYIRMSAVCHEFLSFLETV